MHATMSPDGKSGYVDDAWRKCRRCDVVQYKPDVEPEVVIAKIIE